MTDLLATTHASVSEPVAQGEIDQAVVAIRQR